LKSISQSWYIHLLHKERISRVFKKRKSVENRKAKTKIEELAQWVETWKRAEVALEEIRRKELREFNYEERREAILGMLELAALFRRPRSTSGMIEMQKLFRKARP